MGSLQFSNFGWGSTYLNICSKFLLHICKSRTFGAESERWMSSISGMTNKAQLATNK